MEAVGRCEAEKRVKEFKETKAGVKGIVDSGATKIPKMFIHPPEDLVETQVDHDFRVPVIDLKCLDQSSERRKEVIDEISKAAEEWGFFQIMNHGVPLDVMEEMLKGVRRFHEQPREAKVDWYSLDYTNNTIITNGKFKSVEHRVFLKPAVEPRISVACFLGTDDLQKLFGPIKELISENNSPIYGEVKFGEYMKKYKL